MAIELPHGQTLGMKFMFTKLPVNDLERSATFYTSVFGLVEMQRIDAQIIGRPATEVVYMPTHANGPLLILLKYHDLPKRPNEAVILGFSTDDLTAFVDRLEKAGGRVVDRMEVPGMQIVFGEDIEGNRLQVTQPTN